MNSDRVGKRCSIYGHYDVQPAGSLGSLGLPSIRAGHQRNKIFARGSTDNKGQIFAHILGIESALKERGDFPVNLVLLVEGEEEIGSPHLDSFP